MDILEAFRSIVIAIKAWADENKVEKVSGKGLSTNDYTNADKEKLNGIENGANKTNIADNLMEENSGKALDARQGKILNDKITEVESDIHQISLGNIMTDTTLSEDGKPADAKAVGDALATKQPKGNYLTEVPAGYATEEYVKNKIADAELGGGDVDLSNYATKDEIPTKISQLANDSGFLTEHQDLTDYVKKMDIPVRSVNGMTGDVIINIPESGSSVQPNWNQNNPSQPDYVKNRTHWEENNQTVIEWDGNTDTTGSDSFEYGSSTFVKISDITPGVSELDSAIISMTANGNAQSFVVKDAYGDSSNWWLVQNKVVDFGGMVMIVHETDIDEGVTETAIPSTGTYFNLDMISRLAAERLSLTYGSTVVHHLDAKFLPEGGIGYIDDDLVIISGDIDMDNADIAYVDDEPMLYKISDVELDYTDLFGGIVDATNGEESLSAEINEDNTEVSFFSNDCTVVVVADLIPLYIVNVDNCTVDNTITFPKRGIYTVAELITEVKFKITYGSTIIHKIDDKFIPDSVARKTDVTWENLPDKPFYDSQTVIEWDGNIDGLEVIVETDDCKIVKFSSAAPTNDELVGAKYIEEGDTAEIELDEYKLIDVGGLYLISDTGCLIVNNAPVIFNGITFTSNGCYHMVGSVVVIKLSYGFTKTINEKFIPDSIARKDDIPENTGGVSSWNELLDKPDTLPNPKGLIFTGAASAYYDGSEEVSIEIPMQKNITVNGVAPGENNDIQIDIPAMPEIPVTSVNGMTGDVQIEIHEQKGITVNGIAPDENGNITIEVGGEQVQVDWEESDENSIAYVKNKPFYQYRNENGVIFSGSYDVENENGLYSIQDITVDRIPILGEYYRVYISGPATQFSYKLKEYQNDIFYLGNLSIADSRLEDTGEKFLIVFSSDKSNLSIYSTHVINAAEPYSQNASVIGPCIDYHTIDEKYLPDTIARKSDVLIQSDWNQNRIGQPDYIQNRTHWLESGTLLMEQSELEFIHGSPGMLDNLAQHSFGYEHHIDFNLNNTYTVVFNGESFLIDPVQASWNMVSINQSDGTTAPLNINGSTIFVGNLDLYNFNNRWGMDVSNSLSTLEYKDIPINGCHDLPFLIILYKNNDVSGVLYNDMFMIIQSSESCTATIEIYEGVHLYHTIDERFIPNSIARVNDIKVNTDTTLTIEGQAADAKTVGEALANKQPIGNYLITETDPTVPSWAKASSKPTYTKSEIGLSNVDNIKQYSADNPPPYPVTSVNGQTGDIVIPALPAVTTADNGKVLMVVDGAWAVVDLNLAIDSNGVLSI